MKKFGNYESWQNEVTGYYSIEIEGLIIQISMTKKKTTWKRDVEIYKNRVTEYEKIIQFVEKNSIVFP